MKIDGACHCGHVSFVAEVDPETVAVCHCTDCQTLAGAAFRVVVRAKPATFALRSGVPALYVKTTAESGNHREHAFCPRCGTPIYAANVGEPKGYSLRMGAIHQRDELKPRRQIWTRSRVPWLAALEGVPSVPKQG